MLIIPESRVFDQRTMTLMHLHDPLVQRYRTFFGQIDWSVVPEPSQDPSRPGKRPHPQSAYIKAFLIKITEGLQTCSRLRRFLIEHPLLSRSRLASGQSWPGASHMVLMWSIPCQQIAGCVKSNTRWIIAFCKISYVPPSGPFKRKFLA